MHLARCSIRKGIGHPIGVSKRDGIRGDFLGLFGRFLFVSRFGDYPFSKGQTERFGARPVFSLPFAVLDRWPYSNME